MDMMPFNVSRTDSCIVSWQLVIYTSASFPRYRGTRQTIQAGSRLHRPPIIAGIIARLNGFYDSARCCKLDVATARWAYK